VAEAVRIDDDASQLYAGAGLLVALPPSHPFVQAERARWQRSAEADRLFIARDASGAALGFVALDRLDRCAYLDQLSVRTRAMRRGIGTALLHRAIEWAANAGDASLWLTTYAHLPWNRPYYEKHGFHAVPDPDCGPEVLLHLEAQRRALPAPAQRIAMRRPLDPHE
jgi:GNAT superfamily N-acetyltransferase